MPGSRKLMARFSGKMPSRNAARFPAERCCSFWPKFFFAASSRNPLESLTTLRSSSSSVKYRRSASLWHSPNSDSVSVNSDPNLDGSLRPREWLNSSPAEAVPSSSGLEPRPPRFSVFRLRRFTARGVFNVDEVERKKFRKESTRLTDFFVEFVGGGAVDVVGNVVKLPTPVPKWYFLERWDQYCKTFLTVTSNHAALNYGKILMHYWNAYWVCLT